MADRTGEEQQAICTHIRTAVLSAENSGLDITTDPPEALIITADYMGTIEFITSKESLSISDMEAKWTAHSSGCSDCNGWSL